MITDIRRTPPFAHFGFGRVALTVEAGTPVNVWLQTLYNADAYSTILTGTIPKARVSAYQYTVTPDAPGTYTIKYRIDSKDAAKSIIMNSNTLTLTVI